MKRTKHGFTLVELIIVIAVIGVLAAILIPTFANVIDKANAKSALSDARNTVTQYVTEAFENKSLPENIVIIIKKAGNYYLYGYNTRGDGSIQKARGGEAYKDLDSVKALFEAYSFNEKHAGQVPDSGRTDYEEATDGSFFLVPYDASGNPTVPVKGFHATKAAEELPEETTYPTLNSKITDTVGEDTYIYHGVLLGGTYTLDNGNGGGSNPTNTPAPTPKPKHTITFKAGNTHGNDAKVTLPNGGSVEVEEGSLFVPSAYSASYAHQASDEEWYVFGGWDPSDSFVVTGNAEVTATWVKYTATKYTLTFNASGGILNLASGVTNGMQIITGTDITSYITGSSASKAEHTFKGWTDGENNYNSSSSNIIITDDITLNAVWEEITYKMTIDNDNGDATYVKGSYAIGANVTLPEAPTKSGYVFDYWKTSNPGDDTQYGSTGTYTMPGRDVTITAVWKNKYTVEYLTYTGVKEDEIKINAGTEITLPSTTSVMKPDEEMEGGVMTYQFTGWICSLGGTYAPGAKYEVVNDVIFQAEFRNVPKFTVSFTAGVLSDNAYVSGIPASFTATPTTNINLGEFSTPVYNYPGTGSKFVFDGWLLNGEKRTTYVMAEETVTFVASWIETPAYTVNFDANGGSLNLATLSGWTNGGELFRGTDITDLVNNSTATKANAVFTGWKSSVTNSIVSGTQTVTADVTYTAQWEEQGAEKEYTITVKYLEGGIEDLKRKENTITVTQSEGQYTISADMTWVSSWSDNAYTTQTQYKYVLDDDGEKTVTLGTNTNVTVTFKIKTGLYESGLGTAESPYLIKTNVHFDNVRYNINAQFKLISDIDLIGDASHYFSTIGLGSEDDIPFTGVFDGDGHTVSNLDIRYSSLTNVGIFAINEGTIKNMTIALGSHRIVASSTSGAVAGKNLGLIEKIHVTGSGSQGSLNGAVCAGNDAVGGIVGKNLSGATIRYCSVMINSVEGGYCVGGIAGANQGTIEQCYYKGTSSNICYWVGITSKNDPSQVGGIVGDNYSGGEVSNCYVNIGGKIVTNYAGGGVVGYNRSGATVKNCWVNANIQPVQYNYYAGDNGRGIGLNEGTSSNNIAVVTSTYNTVENGFKRVSAATLKAYTNSSHPTDWSTDIWNFTGTSVPTLKNWNKG